MEAQLVRPVAKQKGTKKKKKQATAVPVEEDDHVAAEVVKPPPTQHSGEEARASEDVNDFALVDEVPTYEDVSYLPLGTNVDGVLSSLVPEASAPSFYPTIDTRSRQEDMVDGGWEFNAFNVYPVQTPVLVEPSAPPMEHRMTDVSAPTLEQLGVEEEIVIEPLEDEVLAGLHVNLELDSHRQIVEEFRGNAAHFPTNDLFFDRLREYDEAYANSQRASLMLKSLQSSANNLGLRVWTLKKTSGSAEDRCADGVRLAHSYISEIGSLNNFDLSELEATFTKMRKEQHSRYKTAVFKSKLIKLWIQNFIDEFLGQMMDPQMEGKSSQFLAIREDDYDLLKHYIDVLFFFERRKRTSVDVEVPLPNGEAEEVNYSPFIRDVRGWTTHLMSALLRVARLLDHRFILLHVLRCEGIGAWGPSFVQWQIPQHWSDDYLNHYLTIVYAFFSPVEEVQEALQQKEVELYELKESLKKLQNLDWIVVDEGDVDIDKGERATIITEDDYLALLDQFNVLPVYGSFLQHCISKASGEQMSRDELSSALLKIFAVTSHLLTSLSRGLDLFTSNKHPRMIKRVAQLVGDMSKACADFLITNLNPWGHDLLEGSFEIPIVASPRVTTTVQAELDACFFRALKVLFTNSRKHVWPFLSSLRFDFVSHRMKWRFIGNMITGHTFSAKGIRNPTFTLNDLLAQFSDVSDGASNILTLLQGNAAESIHLLTFLTNIATCDRTIELSTPSDKFQSPQTQTARATGSFEIAVVVSRIIFFVSFLSVDYRDVLYKPARELLASICQMYPSTISFLLLWVRERFSDVSSMAIYLFSDLPLSQWRPRTNDLGVVQSMLKDPASSPKFQLARFIIGQLNWGYMGLTGSEELFLPRSQHRFIALAIANICLDRQSVRESRSVIGSTTAFASSAIAKVGSMALPTSMSRLYTDYDKEFYEWCWTIILSLQLYQRPTSHNTYTLETVVNGEKPFEPLDSPSLATLRGAMRSSSLAAYLILMMSELGHDFYLFEKDGWALLTVILDGQRSEAVIGVVGEVIIAFARSHGERLLESPNFTKFFTAFYRSRIPLTAMKWAGTEESAFANGVTQDRTDQNDPDGVFRNQLLLGISDDVVLSEGGLDIPGIVWLRTIFGDRDWTSNRLSMRFVDLICEVGLLWGFYGAVREEFTREYKRIWAAYATNQQSASRISLMNPVESVYSLALTMSDMYNGHPTLVLGSPTYVNWATPGFWGKAVTEKDYTYFAYEALLVETDMETELRQTIGNHLSKDSMIQLSQVSKEISKPLSAFTVYKWAFQILDTSPQHPVMPLMWQVFFALYFERASNPITTANACFGFRFFLDKKELLEKLFQRLIRDVVDVASVVLEPEVRRLYNAMTLWIRDSRLTSGGVYIEHLNEQYCLPKLRDTLIGSVLSSPDGRWLDLVQTSQLRSKIRAKLNRFDIPVTSPRGSVLKSPVGDRSAKMLSSSLPAVNYTVRQPLITPLHRFTIAQAIEIFRSDAAMIRDKGLRFQQIVEQNAVCDAEYISTLKGLYLNEQKRGRIEKRCSSACKGPAVINYRYQDVKLVGEVKSSLKENRATAESLSGWDNMDPKVVIGALKLLRAIDWLCGDADNVEGKAIEVFYEMIEVFAEDVRAYPPASIILENVINMIGHNYIMSSPVEILKVFDRLAKNGEILAPIFNPAVAIEDFARMYKSICEQAEIIGVDLTLILLGCFKIDHWLDLCSESKDLKDLALTFLRTVLECIDSVSRNEFVSTLDLARHTEIHRITLRSFYSATLPSNMFPDVVNIVTSACIQSVAPSYALRDLTATINSGRSFDINILSTTDLVDCGCSRDVLTQSIDGLAVIFNEQTAIYSTAVVSELRELMILVSCAKPIYSMISDVHREEIWSSIRHMWLPWMGLRTVEASDKFSPWMVDDLDTASAVTAEYIKLVQKFFKHSSYIKGICAYAWSLYARFQRFKPPAYFLPVLHQNLQELNWEAFEIDEEVVAQIDEWAATRDTNDSLLTIDVHRFLCHVLSSGNWSMREFTPTLSTFESGSSLMRSLTILFTLITNVDTIFPELDSRRTFFTQISTRVGNWCDWRIFPPASYANVIAVLPAKWTSNAETLFAEDAQLSFHYCLNLLKLLIGFESINHAGEIESNKNILTKMTFSKLEFFFDYILDLISTQMTKVPSVSNMSVTEIAAPNSTAGDSRPNKATPLAFSAKTFSPDRIGSHLVELFGFVDAILPTTSEKGHFLYQIIHRVFTILNASSKSTKEYGRLWEGVNLAVRATHDPIVWLSLACQTIASAEYMALIAEICIERHRELMRSTRGFDPDDLEGWKAPVASLAVPELEAETFIRHCLSHALLLTLHVHALQKLEEVSDNPDLRVMIGEQLGIWIAGVKMETVEEGKEGKMVLLLLKFGELLEVELADLVLPEHHSRLRGQLPAVAEALLKWGQDRANQGLWATLGFGPKSRLSSEFRLFARAVGAFVVMRLIGPTSAAGSTTAAIGKREEEQKAKLVESVASTLQNRDFETSWHRVEALVSFLKDEEEKRLVALREFVIIAGWFSEYC